MTFQKTKDGLQYVPMSPARFAEIRVELGMGRIQFGELLGYTGEQRNIWITIKRLEMGQKEVPPMVERLLMLMLWFKADYGYLPDLDKGRREPAEWPSPKAEGASA